MKYVITGSIGHISKPLALQLIAAGHEVTIITSQASRKEEIKAIGAKAAVGSIKDKDFVTRTFAGADAVYLMIPPPPPTITDWPASQKEVTDSYIAALKVNHTKYVLLLSSLGAHMGHGAGPVDGYAYLEAQLKQLPDIHLHVLYPGSFYYNLFGQMGMIKHAGFVGSAQPADFKPVMADPTDIANAGAAYLLNPSAEKYSSEFIASDDTHTWAEITKVLGQAIGKPDLPFVQITDEQSRAGMLQAGLNPVMVEGIVAMGKAIREGKMLSEYLKNPPKNRGKVKLEDFAKQFAAVYNAS